MFNKPILFTLLASCLIVAACSGGNSAKVGQLNVEPTTNTTPKPQGFYCSACCNSVKALVFVEQAESFGGTVREWYKKKADTSETCKVAKTAVTSEMKNRCQGIVPYSSHDCSSVKNCCQDEEYAYGVLICPKCKN